ncbi:PH domain-containing protein [Specibacter cremeus]|uniref:PH domain-containing protein n=1 Tax=Specibacter cremeus TaxID=1629051 RepID=UPI001F0BC374|nr:PH domain-containing protein [Specibacter cremeus]
MPSRFAPGEQLIVRTRPHPRVLVWPVIVGLLVVTGTALVLAWLQPGPFHRLAPNLMPARQPVLVLLLTVAGLLLVVVPLRRTLEWLRTRYLLTSVRLVVKRGWRVETEYPLAALAAIETRRGLGQRLVGAGDLVLVRDFAKPGTIRNVPEVNVFRGYVLEAMGELHARNPGAGRYAGIDHAPGDDNYAGNDNDWEADRGGRGD